MTQIVTAIFEKGLFRPLTDFNLPLAEGQRVRLIVETPSALSEVTERYAVKDTELSSRNRRALALLRDWMAEPDELGSAWWDAFERDLARNRLTLGESINFDEVE